MAISTQVDKFSISYFVQLGVSIYTTAAVGAEFQTQIFLVKRFFGCCFSANHSELRDIIRTLLGMVRAPMNTRGRQSRTTVLGRSLVKEPMPNDSFPEFGTPSK
ncbi:hypothetical protein BD769DRAFT_1385038 [Suillus cothurnatus]|nr:hypothetical protein BD769DRAFT_1385038 [Suillus cothurnatus]